jgi:flagellar motor switch protein FliN/FliY
MAEQGKIQL